MNYPDYAGFQLERAARKKVGRRPDEGRKEGMMEGGKRELDFKALLYLSLSVCVSTTRP